MSHTMKVITAVAGFNALAYWYVRQTDSDVGMKAASGAVGAILVGYVFHRVLS